MLMAAIEQIAAELRTKWPARTQQIDQLVRLIGTACQPGLDVFVHGAPKSGKSTIVRACLNHLKRQHAYCELGDTTKPKQLFSSVLSQLHAVKRKRDSAYVGSSADSLADFVNELAAACPTTKPTAFIVLDGVQLLARSTLLSALMTTREITGANVAYILISSVPFSSQWFFEGIPRTVMPQIYFPAYTEDQTISILVQELRSTLATTYALRGVPQGTPNLRLQQWMDLVPGFVSHIVCDNFLMVTRSLSDLKAVTSYLWEPYVLPTTQEHVEYAPGQALESVTRKLCGRLKGVVRQTVQAFQPGMSHTSLIDLAVKRVAKEGSSVADHARMAQYQRDWGALPVVTKLLVVAAFVASHNKASQDKAVFDSGTRAGRVRANKASQASDRQTEAAKEAKLKGPSHFSLNRLLTIYHYLYMAADHCCSNTTNRHGNNNNSRGLQAGCSLNASFVVTRARLTLMGKCDVALDRMRSREAHENGVGDGEGQVLDHTLQLSQQPQQHQELGRIIEEGEEEEEGDFRSALAQAERRGRGRGRGRGSRGGKGGQRRGAGEEGEEQGAQTGPGTSVLGGLGVGADGQHLSSWRLDSPSAHAPHPVSGMRIHGGLPFTSDAAPLLHNVATLADMGLIKRLAAEDILDAPRLMIGCVDEQLAADLAKDCGLKLTNYLKYA